MKEHHRAAILDNPHITATQIQSTERLHFSNNISYIQAYRTIQAVLANMYGNQESSFGRFPAYAERLQAADPFNAVRIINSKSTGYFLAAFFALAGTRMAHWEMRPLIGFDGTHTSGRWRMTLLIAGGIDANDEVLPLAWGLVPIENEKWWTRFLRFLKASIEGTTTKGYVFISDREKGSINAVKEVFPEAYHSACCQHIADNIQVSFGVKCRPIFWKIARAKTEQLFLTALEELKEISVGAFQYVSAIKPEIYAR